MRTNTNSRLKSFLAVLLGLAVAVPALLLTPTPGAEAAINEQVNFQGRLTDSSGNIVADGDYNVEFKLHDHATNTGGGQGTCSGSCVWVETRTGGNTVTVSRGLFAIQLGEVTSIASVDFNQDLYLSVRLGGTGTPSWDDEMSPRHRLGAVPAAITAAELAGYLPGNGSGQIPISNGTLSTNLNADLLDSQSGSYYLDLTNATGTLADARLSSNVTLQGNTFNGASQLVQLDGSGALPALDGSALTGLDASNIGTGTLSDSRLSSNVTLQGNTFNNANQLVQLDGSGAIVLPGGQTKDITTADGSAPETITIKPGTASGASGTIGDLTLQAGDNITSGTLNGVAGKLTLKGGDESGTGGIDGAFGGAVEIRGGNQTGSSGTRTGGSVSIDAGTGASANGSIAVGTTNAAGITVGRSGAPLTLTGNDSSQLTFGDTNLYRGGSNELATDSEFSALGGRVYIEGGDEHIISVQEEPWYVALTTRYNDGSDIGLQVNADGQLNWAGVGLAPDTNLYRSDANTLTTDDILYADGNIYSGGKLTADDDETEQVEVGAEGPSGKAAVLFGLAEDTNLYRDSANVLKTDDTFDAAAYEVGGTAGSSVTCSGGEFLQNQVVSGGIVTGGSCAAAGGSGLWSANGSDIYYDSGNVGIGLNDPATELQIYGPGTGGGDSRLSFGDYDEATFHGVAIGEEGTGDTDVLQLQGEEGIKVTTGNTSEYTIQVINDNGEADFYPVTDVTGAFQVNNANDDHVIFDVDTQNERVGINDSTPETEIQVRGQGTNGSEGKLSFGDFDDATWHGVTVGEWGTGDTDQLQLQGAGGVQITTGDTGEYTVLDIDAGTGQMDIRPITDNTAAVAVLNAADTETAFSVDTVNSRLGVNDPTPDSRIELERNVEAAEENGIQLSTNDGEDWKIYQPTGSSNLAFYSEATGTDVGTFTTAGQLQLSVQGSGGGITLGGDTQLYRGGADLILTGPNDDLTVGDDLMVGDQLRVGNLDTYLYRGGANLLATDDAFETTDYVYAQDGFYTSDVVEAEVGESAQTTIGAVGPSSQSGIAFGSASDASLYRVGADFLVTPGSLAAGGTIYSDNQIAVEREADSGLRVALDADAGGSDVGGCCSAPVVEHRTPTSTVTPLTI